MAMKITTAMIGLEQLASDEMSLVEHLKALRADMDRARARFMMTLLYVEQNFADQLAEWGHESFDAFIDAHELCRPAKYRSFVSGTDAIGDAKIVEDIGVDATQIAATMTSDETRSKYLATVLQFRESKGVSPSRQVLKDYANRIEERTIEPKALSVGRQLATLRAENQKLRAELRRAERRVAKLQAELERVRGTTAA